MKKAVLFAALMTVLALGAFAQVPASVVGKTFVYYYVETVNTDTGVREVGPNSDGHRDVTVTIFEKSILWEEYITIRGTTSGTPRNYPYLGEENGVYVFSATGNSTSTFYVYFSKDFRRINTRFFTNFPYINQTGWLEYIDVYDQTKPEPQSEPPMELY
jgi:hypothetical protein